MSKMWMPNGSRWRRVTFLYPRMDGGGMILQDITVYEGMTILPTRLSRSQVAWYNYHVHIAENVYRVGEAMIGDRKAYIFDSFGNQWAEFTPTSSFHA